MRFRQALAVVTICLIALSLLPASPARSLDKAEKFARARADMFKKELSLNNEQAAAIEKTCHEAFLQMRESVAGMDPVKQSEEMVQILMNALQRRNADLQKVLKEDQLALYQEHKVERYAELTTEILMVQLDLSESQTGPVHDANLKAFETIAGYMPVLEDGSRTKKRRADKTIKTVLQSRDEKIKGILDSEQWEGYGAYKEALDKIYEG